MQSQNPIKQPTTTPLDNPPFSSPPHYFFTQLSIICQLLSTTIKSQLIHNKLHIRPHHINQQGDIARFDLQYQSWPKYDLLGESRNRQNEKYTLEQFYDEKMAGRAFYKYTVHITVIQISTIIKFHIVYKQIQLKFRESKNQEKHIEQQEYQNKNQQSKMIEEKNYPCNINAFKDRQQYIQVDEFWIKYTNYLPKKLYQSYLLTDLSNPTNIQKTTKLTHIFHHRIIHPLTQKINQLQTLSSHTNPHLSLNRLHPDHTITPPPLPNTKLTNKQLFITTISTNFNKIYPYLKPPQYKNLQISTRQLYKILHTQKNYKILFEEKWGKTGFDLQQKNWIKMYQNKTLENRSPLKKNK